MNNINPTYEQKVYALANMDDKMLRKTAQYQAYYQQRAYSNPKNDKYIKALIWGLPVVNSLFVAHAAEGQLGNKSFAFGKHMLNWVGIFALGYLLNIADKKLMQKIPAYEEFENNHPGIAMIKDLAVFYGLYIGMGKVSKKARKKINLKSIFCYYLLFVPSSFIPLSFFLPSFGLVKYILKNSYEGNL